MFDQTDGTLTYDCPDTRRAVLTGIVTNKAALTRLRWFQTFAVVSPLRERAHDRRQGCIHFLAGPAISARLARSHLNPAPPPHALAATLVPGLARNRAAQQAMRKLLRQSPLPPHNVVSQLNWLPDPLKRLETGAGPAHGHSTVRCLAGGLACVLRVLDAGFQRSLEIRCGASWACWGWGRGRDDAGNGVGNLPASATVGMTDAAPFGCPWLVPILGAIGLGTRGSSREGGCCAGRARKRLGQPSTLPPKAYCDTAPQGRESVGVRGRSECSARSR
jgi:hypothetical protein